MYTKMHLQWDPTGGAYSTHPDPLVAGGERGSLPQNATSALGPEGLEFSALGLKKVVHTCCTPTLNLTCETQKPCHF